MTKISEETFDVRKIDRFLAEGVLTQAQIDEHLAGLEDCADNAEVSSIQMVAHDRSRRVILSEEGGQEEDEG